MSVSAILAPIFVQVALTFALLFWMGGARLAALRAGDVRFGEASLGQTAAWPKRVSQIAGTFHNQLELPILFYTLVVLALITRQADVVFVAMAWLFVLSRLVHAYIYTTTNVVKQRFTAFLVGALVLMAMWILFAAKILFLA